MWVLTSTSWTVKACQRWLCVMSSITPFFVCLLFSLHHQPKPRFHFTWCFHLIISDFCSFHFVACKRFFVSLKCISYQISESLLTHGGSPDISQVDRSEHDPAQSSQSSLSDKYGDTIIVFHHPRVDFGVQLDLWRFAWRQFTFSREGFYNSKLTRGQSLI